MNTSTYEDIILWKHLFLHDGKHNSKQSKYSEIHFMRLTFLRPVWAIGAFMVLRLWSEKHIFRSEYVYGIFPFQKVKSSKTTSWSSLLGCCFQWLFCTIRNRFYSKLNQKDFSWDFHRQRTGPVLFVKTKTCTLGFPCRSCAFSCRRKWVLSSPPFF